MRIVTWNLNHKTRPRDISPQACEGLLSLRPDIIVLTEYVHGPSRRTFLDSLASHGLDHWLVSQYVAAENQVLIASREALEPGPILAPSLARSVPSNTLHALFPAQHFELLGIRVPDYAGEPKTKRACWDWIAGMADGVKDRPFAMIGDFNTDPSYPRSRCGDRIGMLVAGGWQLASPTEGASFWTVGRGLPRRIDHAFVSSHFRVVGSRFVTEFQGRTFVGIGRGMMSDHAILQVDLEFEAV